MIRASLKYALLFLFMTLLSSCSTSVRYANDRNESFLETETGIATYYADEFNGKKTANGEIYNMDKLTAAHPDYPFNSIVKVTNSKNGLSVEVRINDRMPPFKNRIIDLSLEAAKQIDMIRAGIQEVKIEVLKWGE